jgi:hypothetical protein
MSKYILYKHGEQKGMGVVMHSEFEFSGSTATDDENQAGLLMLEKMFELASNGETFEIHQVIDQWTTLAITIRNKEDQRKYLRELIATTFEGKIVFKP